METNESPYRQNDGVNVTPKLILSTGWIEKPGYETSRIVLTHWDSDTTPYVTHIEVKNKGKISGHYHRTYEKAVDDFHMRVKKER